MGIHLVPAANTGQTLDSCLPWARSPAARTGDTIRLTIAWSLDEPDRVGETALVNGTRVLGRGEALPGDPGPRLEFGRARGGTFEARPPLGSPRISRSQLVLLPGGGGLLVSSVGRCPLLINGVEQTEGQVQPGDTIQLQNALVLVVERRPRVMLAEDRLAGYPSFPFGAADFYGMVGESPAAWRLREQLMFAAASGRHVLLLGDSGVGKELAARAIQALSPRRAQPLLSRNAATLPSGIVDAELFGSAKNYPNAGMPERPGLIGEANGATLFLDEVGELPVEQQAHLLRVMDSGGEYQRLGDSRPRRSDFLLIAATNRSPDDLKGDFLARFPIRVVVPGLEERREDIPLMIRLLLARAVEGRPELMRQFFEMREGAPAEPRVHPGLLEALLRHRFTYHTRQLEHLLWVALSTSPDEFVALTDEVARELALVAPPLEVSAPGPERVPEREEVVAALTSAGGSVTQAARALGLSSRFVLYRLLRRYGLDASC